ncbi:hypothetical protein [Candidatus Thiosymbion oneisti]|uniref:hypothetical protein n=1 Tax=Candidatus Thiosymbion oneisti TaxID=589554 RepID=UPI000B7FD970|nr:hypothetical protein [Candidatus Thiosymbion oneisti]
MTDDSSGNLPNPFDDLNEIKKYRKQAKDIYEWVKRKRAYRGWLLTSPERIGVELLTEHDFPKIPKEIDKLLSKSINKKVANLKRLKVVVHFYHEPKDLIYEYRSIFESNRVLLERAYRILWVHDKGNEFERGILAKVPDSSNQYCRFLEMKNLPELRLIPINFTVIAPHYDDNTLTYVRLPGHRDIKFGIKLEEVDDLAVKFNQLALYCLAALPGDRDADWSGLIESAKNQCEHLREEDD